MTEARLDRMLGEERCRIMRAAIRVFVLTSILSVSLSGCASLGHSPSYLDVFRCLIPIPDEYAVSTSEPGFLYIYFSGDRLEQAGSMAVGRYDGPLDLERFEILSSQYRGRFLVEEYKRHDRADEAFSVIQLSDGRQKLLLMGNAKRLLDSMLATCAENPSE